VLSKIQIASLIFKAYEINAENSRYKLCVDYSKCLGDHHVELYVIDETINTSDASRVIVDITVDDKYSSMMHYGSRSFGCSVEEALAEMEKWRESNGAERTV
jgi:hypothetical protein